MRAILLLLSLLTLQGLHAQESEVNPNAKDTLIDQLIKGDKYPEALKAIDSYLGKLHASGPSDSIYSQCYNAARAYWKVKGSEAGVKKGEEIMEWVRVNDPDTAHFLATLNDMSWIYYEVGQANRCIEVDSLSLVICQSFPDVKPLTFATAYHNMGFYEMKMGRFNQGLEHFQSALAVLDNAKVKEYKQRVQSTNAVGACFYQMGKLTEAEKYYLQSYALTDSLEPGMSFSLKGSALNNLMLTAYQRRDYLKAKNYAEMAIKAHNESIALLENPWDREVAIKHSLEVYTNLGLLYETLGDYKTAYSLMDYVIGERGSFMEPNDPYVMGAQESMIGLKMLMGDFSEENIKKTEGYLDYCLKQFGEKSFYTGKAMVNLGGIYEEKKDYPRSIDYYTSAIRTQKAISTEETDIYAAEILEKRAGVYQKMGNLPSAYQDLEAAAAIYAQTRADDDPVVADNLLAKAELSLALNEVERCKEQIETALKVLDKRALIQTEGPDRSLYINEPALRAQADYLKAKCFLKEGNPDGNQLAMQRLESAIKNLKENKSAYTDSESKLFLYENHEKIFDLAQELTFKQYTDLKEENSIQHFFNLCEENKTIMLRSQLQNFSALDYQGVPDSIINKEADLISYLGSLEGSQIELDRLFQKEKELDALKEVIKKDHPDYYRLKYGEQDIRIKDIQETVLNDKQSMLIYTVVEDNVYIMAIEKGQVFLKELKANGFAKDIHEMNKALVASDMPAYLDRAHSLYEKLLGPIINQLTHKEMLIVPDEELYYLNFEILVKSKSSPEDYIPKLLIQDYTISYLLSASTAFEFKKIREKGGSKLMALAPGFSDEMKDRYRSSLPKDEKLDENYLQAIQQPFAIQTAIQVAGIMSGTSYTEDEANESRLKADAQKYGIIHLGTHAEINESSPLLSRLVLSKQNDAKEDGYLYAYEIYEMPLSAELAVLTACETGLGKQKSAEGVISLAHSFAYAGCPSIVMSLWNIDEKSSSSIIEDFYAHLAEGMPKNEALRAAKLAYLNSHSGEESSPYYWAGLVLVGDESPLLTEKSFNVIIILAVLMAAALLFVFIRRGILRSKEVS